jgi:putative ABC transport system permease protein
MTRLWLGLHQTLLRLYPARFRQRHADEVQEIFARALQEEAPARLLPRLRWVMCRLWRTAIAGVGTRGDAGGPRVAMATTGAWADLRYAFRALRRAPWYAASTVTVLAVSLAFATVVHAIGDGVLFKPLPYPNAHELYLIRAEVTADPTTELRSVSPSDVAAWREALPDLPITAMFTDLSFGTRSVDERFFDVIGVRPLVGGFQPDDFSWMTRISNSDREFFAPVLITHGRWRTKHGADPSIVNQQVVGFNRDGRRSGVLVRGVLPDDFVFPLDLAEPPPDMVVPVQATWVLPQDPNRTLQAIIRLPDDVNTAAVEQRLLVATTRAAGLRPPRGANAHNAALERPFDRVHLVPLTTHTGGSSRVALGLLAGAAALLVLLASVSITGLTAARVMASRQEFTLRRALGATGWQVIRLVLSEVFLLVVGAAGVALLAAPTLLTWTLSLLPSTLTLLKTPAIDLRVLGGVGLMSLVCLCLVAVWPAVTTRRSLHNQTGLRSPVRRVSLGLIAVQGCLGFVLLTAGLLTGATALAAWTEDVGYDPSRTVILDGAADNYATPVDGRNKLVTAEARLRQVPGVSRLGYSNLRMFRGAGYLGGSSYGPGGAGPIEFTRDVIVDHDFFMVMGLRAIDGRLPSSDEWRADPPLAVLSERAARLMFPGRSAVGQTLQLTRRPTEPALTVVGVVNDTRYQALDREPVGEVYRFVEREPGTYGSFFVIKLSDDPDAVIPRLVDTAVSAGLKVDRAQLLEDALFAATVHRALPAWMFGSMSLVGLLIVVTGCLGLLTTAVVQRKHELVIRTALGASTASVVSLLVRQQLLATLAGLVVGAVVASGTAHYLGPQLYRVTAFDGRVWALAAALLATVAAGATIVPALRVTRLDVAQALKEG